jgi:hypothetical protein
MGSVFFVTLLPIIIAVVGLIIGVIFVGVIAGLIGMGGMIASSYATKQDNRTLILLSFGMILLFGIGCILAMVTLLAGMGGLTFLGMVIGISNAACAICGIVFSKRVVKKQVVQILLYVLFCVGILAGVAIVLANLGMLWLLA